MSTDEKIMQYVANDAVELWAIAKQPLDNFLKETSKKPNSKMIKQNKFAGNSNYLEIGYIEAKLDQIYHGLWSWELSTVQQVVNGVQVTGHLRVFHPVASTWLTRSGIGFKEFQLSKGASDPTPANLSSKALERDVPIAAAEAFKNAAKKLGNIFGRHLNRSFNYEHVEDSEIMNRIFNNNKKEEEL
jgi:hypothetical protein